MTQRFSVEGDPRTSPKAVITGDRWRVSVLTPGLVRIEWAEDGVFEDRASTFAVNRALPVPAYEIRQNEPLVLLTDCLRLDYDGEEFSASGLVVTVQGNIGMVHTQVWRYGEPADGLSGTTRTLDEVDGATPLDGGVASTTGIAVIDDSASFLIEADGRPAARRPGHRDLYVFARGRDYPQAVADLYAVSGPVPRLPRWALGNWWSRYHPYSAAEYSALLDSFEAERVPLAVAVIDMDWHWVDIDPKYGVGWTGYSWNTDLFPDPPAFLAELHERGLRVTLNVHSADGVRAYEDRYPAMAEAMGIDPASGQQIPFDLLDPRFLDAYFEVLHHPLEDEGVDFWWLDWQQGAHTRIPGVDPLWLLNIAHFNDSRRRGDLPLTFSRYAGPGSHRYPIGFSGDTVISWESLAFQPYFTATASNIGYGWWSHDIGGHFFGERDDALTVRWVQLGVFSPINRLHSSQHPFIHKEPWEFPAQARAAIDSMLRLRHRLIPYLHTMNARAAAGRPLVEPMYWKHPGERAAYAVPAQFRFGTELLVAPVVSPQNADLQLGSAKAWLPAGHWTDLFTGVRYAGDREVRLHRPLETLPVLMADGGLLPLAGADADAVVGTELPTELELVLAVGADGHFDLVEDDGSLDGTAAITPIDWDDSTATLTIGPPTGAVDVTPGVRSWAVTLLGAAGAGRRDGVELAAETTAAGTRLVVGEVAAGAAVTLTLTDIARRGWPAIVEQARQLLERAQIAYDTKLVSYDAIRTASGPGEAAARIQGLELRRDVESALLELALADVTP